MQVRHASSSSALAAQSFADISAVFRHVASVAQLLKIRRLIVDRLTVSMMAIRRRFTTSLTHRKRQQLLCAGSPSHRVGRVWPMVGIPCGQLRTRATAHRSLPCKLDTTISTFNRPTPITLAVDPQQVLIGGGSVRDRAAIVPRCIARNSIRWTPSFVNHDLLTAAGTGSGGIMDHV